MESCRIEIRPASPHDSEALLEPSCSNRDFPIPSRPLHTSTQSDDYPVTDTKHRLDIQTEKRRSKSMSDKPPVIAVKKSSSGSRSGSFFMKPKSYPFFGKYRLGRCCWIGWLTVMNMFVTFRAIIVRMGFICFTCTAVVTVVTEKQDRRFWSLTILIIPLLLDLILATKAYLLHKPSKATISKWFSFCNFAYLICACPPIWIIELHHMDQTNNMTALVTQHNAKEQMPPLTTPVWVGQVSLNPRANESMMIMGEDIENYVHAVYLQERTTTTEMVQRFRRSTDIYPEATTSAENPDDFIRSLEFQNISLRQRKRILEQLLLLSVIVGRWLMPRDGLTRDQLSQLLLINIGTAADILELFEAFEEAVVRQDDFLRVIILSLWQASLLQFCFNKTALKEVKPKRSPSKPEEILVSTRLSNDDQTINNRGQDSLEGRSNRSMELPDVKKENRSYLKRWLFKKDSSSHDCLNNIEHGLNGCQLDQEPVTQQPNISGSGTSTSWPVLGGCIFLCRERPCLCCETELWAIGLSLMLQDLPFLILRVTLIMFYNVKSYSNVFFTCKNTLLILLQVFRSIVIIVESCPRSNDIQKDLGNF